MYYAENLLDRFRHVDALATRGVGGERENATRILRDMEAKYPGIRSQAYPRTPKNDAPDLDAFTAASGNFGGATRTPPPPQQGPAWDWRSAAQDALGWAARMAAEMAAGKEVDAAIDRLVEVQSKNLSSGKFQLSVRFPGEEMAYHLSRMNDMQRATFVEKVTALFREELLYVVTPSEEEAEDE
jgi:hypothetical protein